MLGMTLTGCGSSRDSSSSVEPSEVMVERSISALIQSAQGVALADVEMSVAGQVAKTDSNGLAKFRVNLPKSATSVVVRLTRAGFIHQSVVVAVKDLDHITANLLMVKQTVNVAKIEDAQIIESIYSQAKITIPANAFVLPNGQSATGAVTVEFSPWDIQSSDLNAMPANGVAMTSTGQITNLISAGMITAIFKSVTGEHLQLAKGKIADIQMDLPLDSINNQKLGGGSKIPMWHFDEAKGLWVEEGEGQVVASLSSVTGLAVHATVSHFSTWNWDFKFENAGSVFVQCTSASVAVPCHITAKVKLKDGSGLTKVNSISAEGTTIINMPSEGSIDWTAKDGSGTLIGEKTSGTSGKVIIDLGTPKTNNFVKCKLEDATAVACSGIFETQVNGESKRAEFSTDLNGAYVLSGLKADNNILNWTAYTSALLVNGQWVRYKGTAISNSTAKVEIVLKDQEVIASDKGLKFRVQCNSHDYNNGNDFIDPALEGKPCEVQVEVNSYKNGNSVTEKFVFNSIYGQPRQVQLPNTYTGFEWLGEGNISYIYIEGRMLNKTYCSHGVGSEGFKPDENPLLSISMYQAFVSDSEEFCEIPR